MTTDVSYGATFNLGNYENERIDIRLATLDGETPEAALARAKAFVAAGHAATLAERERAQQIERAQGELGNLDYWIKEYCDQAARYGLRGSLSVDDVPPPPDSDDELAHLQWEVAT